MEEAKIYLLSTSDGPNGGSPCGRLRVCFRVTRAVCEE